ncbi:excinuclease ABC subunit UvrC [Crocinitomicaceae bacterium CZZ-1]|uniref:UvrABC system protein C n=1 Tax=Taishania pollutisoli TaxID=2766479 RepID=A0A8J6TT26_9FLAO|nr:excinuclease ABC subunit UvrC [Taishania pollutisoli]MBC9812219.1 excinuclease ABC subunit UvrC [Taishania pollutisoli]
MDTAQQLLDKIKLLPDKPGVYQYFNEKGAIIYVGKAKNLKKRVTSYFSKTLENNKTRLLVKAICDIQYIVVDTELDALLLENNLIKEYKPKYNIQLKDDKTYPWICVRKEAFPRVFSTRNIVKDGSMYFGPYSSVRVMNTLLQLIRDLYPLRTCSLDLRKQKLEERKYKVCLEYHIGNCLGPCVGRQSEASYNQQIEAIETILKGNISSVINLLKKQMKEHADVYAFEEAQEVKEKLDVLQRFQAKSTIVSPKIHEVDVITMVEDGTTRFVNYLSIISGAIVHGLTIEVKTSLDETDEQVLDYVLLRMREQFNSQAKEVLVERLFETELSDIRLTVPQIGDKKSLLELSQRNASFYRLEKRKKESIKNPEKATERILEQIKKDFRLKELPVHIECFDNSNIQGTNPVSACVVFKNAKPSKKDYRHFNIKTVEGPNDFASMEEAVFRRYKRMVDEEESLPQLIVIDGGKGQLSSAMTALDQLNLRGKVAIVGIAKKLEEIFFPGDSLPIYIDKRSESLKVIQHLRNEAHRFGITHHRNKRSKSAIQSELLEVKGIGEKTQVELMKYFKSVKRIKEASLEELEVVIGKGKAALLFQFLNK